MAQPWTPEDVLKLSSSYQSACVLAAAADLDLFDAMAGQPSFTADEAARKVQANPRGTAVLLDALAALGLLTKTAGRYEIPTSVAEMLTSRGSRSVLAMAQHQANCMRRWTQLAEVIKGGKPAVRRPSIRGEQADYTSFIEAMDNISGPVAAKVIGDLMPLPFKHLLDIGGGSGSWTIAFLRVNPSATATIFDLPHVMPQARERMQKAGLLDRTKLASGDYMVDALPAGADLALISAIIHSLSRDQSRMLYRRAFDALGNGGQVIIRDFFMDASRTQPPAGALFAVNMLTGTEGGGTYTFDEVKADLEATGFRDVRMLRSEGTMNAVVGARKA